MVYQFIITFEILYYLCYGALAYVGAFIHPFYFCFHLSEVLIRYPDLNNAVLAIYGPRWDLFYIMMFTLLIVYWFSIINYMLFFEMFRPTEDNPDNKGWCDSMFVCFLTMFDWLLKNPEGGFGT